jgi:hypothetical protein
MARLYVKWAGSGYPEDYHGGDEDESVSDARRWVSLVPNSSAEGFNDIRG